MFTISFSIIQSALGCQTHSVQLNGKFKEIVLFVIAYVRHVSIIKAEKSSQH